MSTQINTDSSYDSLKDEDLVEMAQNGDKEAESLIFIRYRKYIKAKARIYFLIGGDYNDIEQEGLVGLYGALRGYKRDKDYAFKTFAEVCVTRQILTAIKTATRLKHMPLNSYVSLNKVIYAEDSDRTTLIDTIEEINSNNPEDIIIVKESYKNLENKIVSKLSDLELRILGLYLKGKSYEEIAEIINRDKKAVDNALQRIKKKIVN